jgi:hypothetical protein
MTPGISPTQEILSNAGTQVITEGVNTATTVLPIPPVTTNFVPNPDLIKKVSDSA